MLHGSTLGLRGDLFVSQPQGCLTPEGPRLVPQVPKCCFFSNLLLGDCAASQMWSQPATLFMDVLDLPSPMYKMRIMKARTIHQFLNQIYFHFVCICMCMYHSPYIFWICTTILQPVINPTHLLYVLFAATLNSVRILYVTCTKTKYIVKLMHSCKQEHHSLLQHSWRWQLVWQFFVNNCRHSKEKAS